MTIHAPIYKNTNTRIACRSNGLWQVQQRNDKFEEGSKTRDPWRGISRWMAKDDAAAMMNLSDSKLKELT